MCYVLKVVRVWLYIVHDPEASFAISSYDVWVLTSPYNAQLRFFWFKRNRYLNISCKQNKHIQIPGVVDDKTKCGQNISEILIFFFLICDLFFSFLSIYSFVQKIAIVITKWPLCKLVKCTLFLHIKFLCSWNCDERFLLTLTVYLLFGGYFPLKRDSLLILVASLVYLFWLKVE